VVALGAKLGGKPPAKCAGGGADLTSLRGEEICGSLSSAAESARNSRKPSPGLLVRWGGSGNSSNVRRVPGTCKRGGCQQYIQDIILTFIEALEASDDAGEEWRGGGSC